MKTQLTEAFNLLIDKLDGWLNAIIQNIPNLILALLVLTASYFIAKYVNILVNKLVSKQVEQDSISQIIARISATVVVFGGLFLALGIMNLGKALTSLLAGAGVAGLVIGLALQGTLSNTIAGIVLSFRKKIEIGHWVETNGFSGEVMDINLKDFTLKESDNNIVVIPNKMILENPLKNYTLTKKMRVFVDCGVGYESDLDKVEKLTKQTIADSFEQIESPEDVEFFYTEYGASSINYVCRFWIVGENSFEKIKAKSKAIKEIKKAYNKENINIPFPIRTLQFDDKLSFDVPKSIEKSFSNN